MFYVLTLMLIFFLFYYTSLVVVLSRSIFLAGWLKKKKKRKKIYAVGFKVHRTVALYMCVCAIPLFFFGGGGVTVPLADSRGGV